MPKTHRGPEGVLHRTRVREVMTTPIVTCAPEVHLGEVAELMTEHRIHSVVVLAPVLGVGAPAHRRWGVLSSLDLVAAGRWDEGAADAGGIAASPQAVVQADDRLAAAAHLMAEYATTHLLVIEEGADEPVGIVSALDVARVLSRSGTVALGRQPRHRRAAVGDRLTIAAHRQGGRPRVGEIVEMHGPHGGPPYLVRWEDGGLSLHYPGSDAAVAPGR